MKRLKSCKVCLCYPICRSRLDPYVGQISYGIQFKKLFVECHYLRSYVLSLKFEKDYNSEIITMTTNAKFRNPFTNHLPHYYIIAVKKNTFKVNYEVSFYSKNHPKAKFS